MYIALVEHRFIHIVSAFGLWLVLSGHVEPLFIVLGLGSAILTEYLARRMRRLDGDYHPFAITGKLLRYWLWLTWAVLKSNLDVSRRILSRRLAISPQWLHMHTAARSDVGMATLANAITLTPGTVSLDVDAGVIDVHALSTEAAEELKSGVMLRKAPDAGSGRRLKQAHRERR